MVLPFTDSYMAVKSVKQGCSLESGIYVDFILLRRAERVRAIMSDLFVLYSKTSSRMDIFNVYSQIMCFSHFVF